MAAAIYPFEPRVGMVVTFKETVATALVGVPGRVTQILAKLANGDYLVSVEYDQPVKFRDTRLTKVDALASFLDWSIR